MAAAFAVPYAQLEPISRGSQLDPFMIMRPVRSSQFLLTSAWWIIIVAGHPVVADRVQRDQHQQRCSSARSGSRSMGVTEPIYRPIRRVMPRFGRARPLADGRAADPVHPHQLPAARRGSCRSPAVRRPSAAAWRRSADGSRDRRARDAARRRAMRSAASSPTSISPQAGVTAPPGGRRGQRRAGRAGRQRQFGVPKRASILLETRTRAGSSALAVAGDSSAAGETIAASLLWSRRHEGSRSSTARPSRPRLRGRVGRSAPGIPRSHDGRKPGLAVVLVGEDPASGGLCPLQGQGDASRRAWRASSTSCPADDRPGRRCSRWSSSSTRDPARRRHPRPAAAARSISTTHAVLAAINPDKDVDGFHLGQRRPARRRGCTGFVPCTPLGCLMLLKDRAGRSVRARRRGDRPLEHRRQADGGAAAPRRAAR